MSKKAPTGRRYRAAAEQAYEVPDLAAAWRMDETELRRICARGEMPGAFKVGRCWRIPAASAKAWRLARTPVPLAER